jgi:hypothetical protein
MTPRRRWFIIAGLMISTLVAAAWVHNAPGDKSADIVAAVAEKTSSRTDSAASLIAEPGERQTSASYGTPQVNLDRLTARDAGAPVRDPFAIPPPKGRKTVPRNTASNVPVPAPVAPPMPFTYMGKLNSGPDTNVFLTQGDRNLIVHEGETIDSTYRVEHVSDKEITLLYLPLGERQKIVIGESE